MRLLILGERVPLEPVREYLARLLFQTAAGGSTAMTDRNDFYKDGVCDMTRLREQLDQAKTGEEADRLQELIFEAIRNKDKLVKGDFRAPPPRQRNPTLGLVWVLLLGAIAWWLLA